MRIAIFDCPLGIAGDMTVGAFIDAGMPFELLERELGKLHLHGYDVFVKEAASGAFRGKKFSVHLDHHHEHGVSHHHHGDDKVHHHHTALKDIEKMIQSSKLHAKIKTLAIAIFRNLGKAESKVHGIPIQKIHFHEVGAMDSIIDIVSIAICFYHLKIEKAYVRNIVVGRGIQKGAHGKMPIPVPGAYELLKGFYLTQSEHGQEMVTPTGAAILQTLCEKSVKIPKAKIESIGYGLGDRKFDGEPGMVRIAIGKTN
jgi:pyridinium-3,5-bisthiocarboxylic acid mononucleotide nickel chelatase